MIDTLGIKKKILDKAIQGELTSNNPELQAPVIPVIEGGSIEPEELPFAVPSNWRWSKIGWVMGIERGGSPRPIKAYLTDADDGINWIKIGDVEKNGKYIEKTKEKIKPEGESKSRRVYPGDFLLTNSMSFGRPYISKIEGCVHDGWLILRNERQLFYYDFLYYLLSSPYVYAQFTKKATGSTVDNLNIDKAADAIVPIPPIEEQKAIVSEIEKAYAVLEEIDDLQEAYRNNLKALRGKIIDAGIRGLLTKDNEPEEDADALFSQIQKKKEQLLGLGKIKREKPLPEIDDSDVPFIIPDNWKWVRWGQIVNIVSAKRVHQSDWRKEGVPFYRAREIAKLAESGYVENDLYISEELFEEFSKSGVPHGGDLMVSAVGTLGKTYIVKDEDKFYYKDASVLCFENFADLNPVYLRYVMDSDMMRKQIESNSGGTTVDTLTMVRMVKYLLPLPPKNEQQMIADRIDAILSIL